MDQTAANNLAEAFAWLSPTRNYWRIENFVSGSPETPVVRDCVRSLSVATQAEQQQISDTINDARDPAIAARRLFFAACAVGNQRLVEFLRPLCDVNVVDETGYTPLLRAAQSGRLAIIQFLLDEGADPHSGDSYAPLLRNALAGDCQEIVALVMELAGDHADISEILGNDPALFAKAVAEDRVAFAALLLAHGALARSEDNPVNTSLLLSIQSVEMAQLLHDNGADFGGTAGVDIIVEAMCRNNTPLIAFFLDHGVDIRRPLYRASSPLHCACIYRRNDLIEVFAAQCIDMDARLEDGSTPLQKCFGNEATHRLLVELGADIHARSNTGADSTFRAAHSWKKPMSTTALWASKDERRASAPSS